MEHGHGVKGLETIVCMIAKLEWATQGKSLRARLSGTLRDAKYVRHSGKFKSSAQWYVMPRYVRHSGKFENAAQ
jgi:hypothetical protein